MTYTADVSMFPYFKKDDAKVVKKVVVINETQKKVWRLEAQNEMLRMELDDVNRIAEDHSNESFGYEKGYKRLKEEIKELKEEYDYQVEETDRLGELETIAWIDFYGEKEVIHNLKPMGFSFDILAMKEENKKLKEGVSNLNEVHKTEIDFLMSKNVLHKEVEEQTTTIEKLKEEKNKYFGYLKDKDLECEEQREHGILLCVAVKELKEQAEDALASLNFYKECNEELKEEIKDHKKTKEELYETIMELKNPVTNYDQRCGVLKARFNHAYLMGFMYGHHIDPDMSRSVDDQEEFDGVIEHMSKEVENVIDTYLQDSLIYGTQMTLNEVIREKLDDIIDQAIDDGIVKEIDDSSDED